MRLDGRHYWIEIDGENGSTYYYDVFTRTTQFEKPDGFEEEDKKAKLNKSYSIEGQKRKAMRDLALQY